MNQSIIITYHKGKDMLMYCLNRILKTVPEEVEIFIIGNNVNSSDLDIEITNSRCRYHKVYKNIQYPKALNLSVEMCAGEIITFVDADIFVWDGWYEALLKTFYSSNKIGVVGAKLVNPLNNRILDFGIMYSKFNAAHTMMGLLYNHPLAADDRRVQTVCSAIMMTSKTLYQKVGEWMKTSLILIQIAIIVSVYAISVMKHGCRRTQLLIIKEEPTRTTQNPVLAITVWTQKECMA